MPPPTVPSVAPPVVLPPTGTGIPIGKAFDLHLGVRLTEEYSDNFNLTPRGGQDNFRTVLSPLAVLGINGAFTRGLLSFALGATHDSSESDDEIQIFPSLAGSVSWQATPLLTLSLSDSFTRTDEPSQADRLSLRRERTVFVSNSLNADAVYQLGPVSTRGFYSFGWFSSDATPTRSSQETISHTFGATATTKFYTSNTASVGYDYLISDTSGGESRLGTVTADNLGANASHITGHRFTATYDRQLSRAATVGVTGSYSIRHTEQSNQQGDQDYNLWSVSIFESYTTGNLSLAGSVGYSQTGGQGSGSNNSSITTTSSITYRFGYALASLSVDSGFSETFAQGENFGVVETRGVTGTLSYQFTPFLGTTLSGYYRQNTTTGGGSGDQNTWGASARLEARLTRWLGMSLDYTHTDASDSGGSSAFAVRGGNGYVENRVRLSLQAFF